MFLRKGYLQCPISNCTGISYSGDRRCAKATYCIACSFGINRPCGVTEFLDQIPVTQRVMSICLNLVWQCRREGRVRRPQNAHAPATVVSRTAFDTLSCNRLFHREKPVWIKFSCSFSTLIGTLPDTAVTLRYVAFVASRFSTGTVCKTID